MTAETRNKTDTGLMTANDIRTAYALAEKTARRLVRLLPARVLFRARLGDVLVVEPGDVERALRACERSNIPLWLLVKCHTPASFAVFVGEMAV